MSIRFFSERFPNREPINQYKKILPTPSHLSSLFWVTIVLARIVFPIKLNYYPLEAVGSSSAEIRLKFLVNLEILLRRLNPMLLTDCDKKSIFSLLGSQREGVKIGKGNFTSLISIQDLQQMDEMAGLRPQKGLPGRGVQITLTSLRSGHGLKR